jgi:hypothetical protein
MHIKPTHYRACIAESASLRKRLKCRGAVIDVMRQKPTFH